MTNSVFIPADVPKTMHPEFVTNYNALTKGTGRLVLFAGDQKLEHLNENFYGPDIPPEVNNPDHLFSIAQQGNVSALATHLGLIARLGHNYPSANYLVKLNGKTNIIPKHAKDPLSTMLWTVDDVVEFKKNSELHIRGVGYTVYVGSEHEAIMLHEAAQVVYQAHQHGLIAILWMYPRGKHVANELDSKCIIGAAGIAATLGADFAKINTPQSDSLQEQARLLSIAAQAAGNTKLICSGGTRITEKEFLEQSYYQLHEGNTAGRAIGRNIYQHSLPTAIKFTQALSALVFEGKSVTEAYALYQQKI